MKTEAKSPKSKEEIYVFLIIAHVFSSIKLEKRAEQTLPGNEGGGEGEGRDRGLGGEMTQTMYAHMNK
jgi:hypothetical protein